MKNILAKQQRLLYERKLHNLIEPFPTWGEILLNHYNSQQIDEGGYLHLLIEDINLYHLGAHNTKLIMDYTFDDNTAKSHFIIQDNVGDWNKLTYMEGYVILIIMGCRYFSCWPTNDESWHNYLEIKQMDVFKYILHSKREINQQLDKALL